MWAIMAGLDPVASVWVWIVWTTLIEIKKAVNETKKKLMSLKRLNELKIFINNIKWKWKNHQLLMMKILE
jgi:hypothetical protein